MASATKYGWRMVSCRWLSTGFSTDFAHLNAETTEGGTASEGRRDVVALSSSSSSLSAPLRPFSEVPGPRHPPLIGTFMERVRDAWWNSQFHEAIRKRYRTYGSIFRETRSGLTTVYLFDPEHIKALYAQEDSQPLLPYLLGDLKRGKAKDAPVGLGNMNGEQWYQLRNALQEVMMKPTSADAYVASMDQVAEDFLQRIDSQRSPDTGEVANFMNELSKYIFESSVATCFDTRLCSLDAQPGSAQQYIIDSMLAVMDISTTLLFKVIPWHRWFNTPLLKQLACHDRYCESYTKGLLNSTLTKIFTLAKDEQLGVSQYRFIRQLIGSPNVKYEDAFSVLTDMLNDSLRATAPNLASQLFCLATNPEKQEKLYREISTEIGDTTEPLTAEVINRMPYLRACVKEGFRLFPGSSGIERITKTDIAIGGYRIPSGTKIFIVSNLLQRESVHFDEPNTYLPERWERGYSGKRNPLLVLPFGFGARTCLGRRFAQHQLYVSIARLVQTYRFEWPHQRPMKQQYAILFKPDVPPQFRIIPRQMQT